MAQIMYSWLRLATSLKPTSVRFVGWFINGQLLETLSIRLANVAWTGNASFDPFLANFWKAQSIEPKKILHEM